MNTELLPADNRTVGNRYSSCRHHGPCGDQGPRWRPDLQTRCRRAGARLRISDQRAGRIVDAGCRDYARRGALFSAGRGATVRFFEVDMSEVTNVLGAVSLMEADYKHLIATLVDGDPDSRIDNIVAVSFGPELNGTQTPIFPSDNNFNQDGQFTQFLGLYDRALESSNGGRRL
ncbi:MAG: esterase-like activity of phytase family protein [Pseudomonadota bacterium]